MATQDLVRPIGDVGLDDRPVVGGKGASLGELSRAGLTVPAGFIVTARAFERALRAARPRSCYLSGKNARRMAIIARLLPVSMQDALRRKLARQPVPGSLSARSGLVALKAGTELAL